MKLKRLYSNELNNNIAIIMGTRPGIIKMSPLVKEFTKRNIPNHIIHTGQHYSKEMDLAFFEELDLPKPEYRVDNTKNYTTHADQTAEMLSGVEHILLQMKPKVVLVCGDANTNLAAGLAARKLGIILGHVESGLRSHDWSMPEEHNRIILDHISELLFAPTPETCKNLIMDNVRGEIILTGNTIVDSTLEAVQIALKKDYSLKHLKVKSGDYILFTSHREENVDIKERLLSILDGIRSVAKKTGFSIVFPIHPRTKKRLIDFGIMNDLILSDWIQLIEPVGYLDSILLIKNAAITITDSGGIQEESCILKTPCVTIRDNTERPETVAIGSNCIAGVSPEGILTAAINMLAIERTWEIPFGDGHAARRIADSVENVFIRGARLIDVSTTPRLTISEIFTL